MTVQQTESRALIEVHRWKYALIVFRMTVQQTESQALIEVLDENVHI